MKVRITEDVTVETEVALAVQDMLIACWNRIEDLNDSGRRTVYGCIDTATKVLAAVPVCVLEVAPPPVIDEVIRRLTVEMVRWKALKTREKAPTPPPDGMPQAVGLAQRLYLSPSEWTWTREEAAMLASFVLCHVPAEEQRLPAVE